MNESSLDGLTHSQVIITHSQVRRKTRSCLECATSSLQLGFWIWKMSSIDRSTQIHQWPLPSQAVATLKATINLSSVVLIIMEVGKTFCKRHYHHQDFLVYIKKNVTVLCTQGPETSFGASNFIPSWMYWQKLPRVNSQFSNLFIPISLLLLMSKDYK